MTSGRAVLLRAMMATVLSAGGAFTLDACMTRRPPLTEATFRRLSTRSYPGRTREQVVQAAAVALRLNGYDVVTLTPRIRTAPKTINVAAVANGYTAQTLVEAIAWAVDVQEGPQGTAVNATPQYTVNGQDSAMFEDAAVRHFELFYRELESNLPAAAPGTPGAEGAGPMLTGECMSVAASSVDQGVTESVVTSPLPTAAGGPVPDGIYHLTAYEWHAGGTHASRRRNVLRVTGTQVEMMYATDDQALASLRGTATFSPDGTMSIAVSCPRTATLEFDRYAVTAEGVTLISTAQGKHATFSRSVSLN